MEQSSSEKQLRIRKQFDSFCKTLLKNEMIDYERARSYRQKHEVSFSELTQEELSRLNTEDDYIAESEVFRVLDYDVEVKDELISEALKYSYNDCSFFLCFGTLFLCLCSASLVKAYIFLLCSITSADASSVTTFA